MILMSSLLFFFFYSRSDTRYISLNARFTSNFLHLVADNIRDNFKSQSQNLTVFFFNLLSSLFTAIELGLLNTNQLFSATTSRFNEL